MGAHRLQWSDSLNLGVAEIDNEHKQLLQVANELLDAVAHGRGEDAIERAVAQLREYTVTHFAHEEKYMERIAYPQLQEHVQQHKELTDKVKEFQRARFLQEEVSVDSVKNFLKTWLLEHILVEDMAIGEFAKARGYE